MKNECLRLLGFGKTAEKLVKKESNDEAIRDDLIDEMDFVASDMEALSRAMEYFAGFNEEMREKARQLKFASAILEQWAYELEENSTKGLQVEASRK